MLLWLYMEEEKTMSKTAGGKVKVYLREDSLDSR